MALLGKQDLGKPLLNHLMNAEPPAVWKRKILPEWLAAHHSSLSTSLAEKPLPGPELSPDHWEELRGSELNAWAFWSLNRYFNPRFTMLPNMFHDFPKYREKEDGRGLQIVANIVLVREMLLIAGRYHIGTWQEPTLENTTPQSSDELRLLNIAIQDLPKLWRLTHTPPALKKVPGQGLEVGDAGQFRVSKEFVGFDIPVNAVLTEFFEAVNSKRLISCFECGLPFYHRTNTQPFCSYRCQHRVSSRKNYANIFSDEKRGGKSSA